MNILVCVKQVPNTKHMTIDPKTNRLVRHGVSTMINPSARYTLEKALRFREQHGGKPMADIICKEKRPQMGTVREGVFVKPEKCAGRQKLSRLPRGSAH